MKLALGLALPLLAAVIQVTVLRFVGVGEVRPDLLALVVVCWTLAAGAGEGIWWAFIAGLTADLLGSAVFGATTVSLLPIALLFGLRDRSAPDPGVLSAAALVGLGALVHQVLQSVVLALVGASLPPFGVLAATAVGAAIYTGVLALGAYPGLRVLHRRTTREPAFDW